MPKIKSILSSSFLNGSEKEIFDNFTTVHPIEKTKRHLIPHVIPVQMIYKRSHANKMAAVHCQNKDGFAEKEGTVLHHFIYGKLFNI